MPVRERFLSFEEIITSRPEDLGAEIVLDQQRRPQSSFPLQTFQMSSRGTTTRSRPLKSLPALYSRRLIGRAANSCLYRDMALPHLRML
jgi:hypothetical protein